MPHRIRITDVCIERLQDISDDDCLEEGVIAAGWPERMLYHIFPENGDDALSFVTPRGAFAALINGVSRRDVWAENPLVFVYSFELIK